MTRSAGFAPEAERELLEAVAWYDERSRGLGNEFTASIAASVGAARRLPGRGAFVEAAEPGLEIRRLPVGRFPYQLIYLVAERSIVVLAVAHDRRRPGYWGRRAQPN